MVLQLKLRERFGWWPVAQGAARQALAGAVQAVRDERGVPARVVLVGPDWATVLNESRVLKLPH